MKTPSSRPILIYFEFTSKPLLITVICMPPSLAQQILICCDKILFSHTQRGYQFLFLDYFIIFRFFFLLFYVLINFYKNYFIIIIILLFFLFMKVIFIFSCSGMLRDAYVPECSGMFRNVPGCSMFRILSTPLRNCIQNIIFQKVDMTRQSYRKRPTVVRFS